MDSSLTRTDDDTFHRRLLRRPFRRPLLLLLLLLLLPALLPPALLLALIGGGGCSTIRVTDPPHTASEQFLENVATTIAVDQLATAVLRDRKVYIEAVYLSASTQPSDEHQYLLGELRAKLLLNGVRIVDNREKSDIVMEVRSQGISIDRIEFLLGLPASSIGGIFTGGVAATTPELAILKTTKQHGFASVAYIAYWTESGEVVASSGPFVGRTIRDDWWFFGWGPRTKGNVPPAEPAPAESSGGGEAGKKPAETPKQNEPPVKSFHGKGPEATTQTGQ
jgi:hypothetical protein